MDMQANIEQFKKVIADNNLKFDSIEGKKVKGSCIFDSVGEYSRSTGVTMLPPEKGEYIASVSSIGTEIKRIKVTKVTDVVRTEECKKALDPRGFYLYIGYPSVFSEARKHYYDWILLHLDSLKIHKKEIIEEDLSKLKLGESSMKRLLEAAYEKEYLLTVPPFEMEVAFDKKFDKFPHEAKGSWVKIENKEQKIPFKWNGESIKKMDLIIKMASKKDDPLEIETMEMYVIGDIKREIETILDWQDGKWIKEPEECILVEKLVDEALFNYILVLLRASGQGFF
jgi:hypothetical protein